MDKRRFFMTIPTVEELALSERKFLHDIANHILVAHGMSTLALKALSGNASNDAKDLNRLERSIEAINKMTALLVERRNFLHSLESNSTKIK
jgi:hypothetical protein